MARVDFGFDEIGSGAKRPTTGDLCSDDDRERLLRVPKLYIMESTTDKSRQS